MKNYLDLVTEIVTTGVDVPDRTGTGRRRLLGRTLRFSLKDNTMPLVTTRKMYPKTFIAETLMFIYGQTNISFLHEHNVKIWDHWAVTYDTGESMKDYCNRKGIPNDITSHPLYREMIEEAKGGIGPMYGAMWRDWPRSTGEYTVFDSYTDVKEIPSDIMHNLIGKDTQLDTLTDDEKDRVLRVVNSTIDQLDLLVKGLKKNPYSSRHVVTALNPEFAPIEDMPPDVNVLHGKGCLLPCHVMFQCFVNPAKEEGGKKRLSLQFTMRSTDVILGLPYNIASYALLTHLLAKVTDMEADELIFSGGDVHVYLDQADTFLIRQRNRECLRLATIKINDDLTDLFAVKASDIEIDYIHQDPIVYPISV